ncbi:dynein axonemal heavy chain 14-like [Amia ocellicauda]|uniref:dynein axonemal heavy chain 14-like n=1 Tax=Amia ocellicauda TaxID=2972642 RepID=UPI00346446CD
MATSPSQSPLAKDIGYGTTLVSYGEGEETMCDFLLHRVFARTQPGLHDQLKRAAHTVLQLKSALKDLERKFQESVCSSPQETDALTDIFNNKKQLSERLERVKSLQSSLSQRRNALLPIAQRGALIYAVLRALSVLAREYKFPLSYFLCLFENAVEKFLKEDGVAQEETDIKVEDAWPDAFSRAKSITDPEVTEAPDPSDRQQRNDPPGEEPSENNFDKPATVPDLLDGAQPQQIVDKTDTLTDCETSLSLSTNQIGQLVDHLTETVHQTINH